MVHSSIVEVLSPFARAFMTAICLRSPRLYLRLYVPGDRHHRSCHSQYMTFLPRPWRFNAVVHSQQFRCYFRGLTQAPTWPWQGVSAGSTLPWTQFRVLSIVLCSYRSSPARCLGLKAPSESTYPVSTSKPTLPFPFTIRLPIPAYVSIFPSPDFRLSCPICVRRGRASRW